MDVMQLSRMQFGITVGFHYLYPVVTLGLTFFILIFETLFLVKKEEIYRTISTFFIKILGLIFTVGVATGLMLPFAFGANWSRFSIFAGPIFGAQLAVEAISAFALESAFISILIFGRKKVSKTVYWLSAMLVFFGSHLSGFWIVSANSWMQTPAGHTILADGTIALANYWKAVFNPSTVIRFLHVVTAAWLTGSFFTAGIAAILWLRGKKKSSAGTAPSPENRRSPALTVMALALPLMLLLALTQFGIGHSHILEVLRDSPVKDAAYEGIFDTVSGAPLIAMGIPDAKNSRILFAFQLPKMLSFLESGKFDAVVKGLNEYDKKDWPPVNVIFTTFHLMVLLGGIMLLAGLAGTWYVLRRRLEKAGWLLKLLPWLIPAPILANELGWIGAEIGRQPWVIRGLLRTSEAWSPHVSTWQVGVTLGAIVLVFALLISMTVALVSRTVREESWN